LEFNLKHQIPCLAAGRQAPNGKHIPTDHEITNAPLPPLAKGGWGDLKIILVIWLLRIDFIRDLGFGIWNFERHLNQESPWK
jgi:hypothetical protein